METTRMKEGPNSSVSCAETTKSPKVSKKRKGSPDNELTLQEKNVTTVVKKQMVIQPSSQSQAPSKESKVTEITQEVTSTMTEGPTVDQVIKQIEERIDELKNMSLEEKPQAAFSNEEETTTIDMPTVVQQNEKSSMSVTEDNKDLLVSSNGQQAISIAKPKQDYIEVAKQMLEAVKGYLQLVPQEKQTAASTDFASLQNAIQVLMDKEEKRRKLLAPVNMEQYKMLNLKSILDSLSQLWNRVDGLRENIETYQSTVKDITANSNLLEKCQTFVKQYAQLSEETWDLRQKIQEETKKIEEKIQEATFHPHSQRAKETNQRLFYIDSVAQDEVDQALLEENRTKYEELRKFFENFKAKELRSFQVAVDTVVKGLNWLCYQYEYKTKNFSLPSYYTTYTVPETVINPFAVEKKSEIKAVVKEKQNLFLMEKVSI